MYTYKRIITNTFKHLRKNVKCWVSLLDYLKV